MGKRTRKTNLATPDEPKEIPKSPGTSKARTLNGSLNRALQAQATLQPLTSTSPKRKKSPSPLFTTVPQLASPKQKPSTKRKRNTKTKKFTKPELPLTSLPSVGSRSRREGSPPLRPQQSSIVQIEPVISTDEASVAAKKTIDSCFVCCGILILLTVIITLGVLIWDRYLPDRFNRDCLRRHNFLRSLHHSPPLIYDARLARSAQDWADMMSASQYLSKDPNKNYGENVCQLNENSRADISGHDVADMFYMNHDWFSYDVPELSADCCYQYSQMVWVSTRILGCAYNQSLGSMFISCKYFPPGNIVGQFKQNVLPEYQIVPVPYIQ